MEGPRDGWPVLCVHGAPGSVRDFRYLAPELTTRGARVFRIDVPGWGGTPTTVGPDQSTRARAELVAFAARALGLERPTLMAHSIGGAACLVAAAGSSPVRALCLINSVGVERHQGLSMPQSFSRVMDRALAIDAVADRLVPTLRDAYGRAGVRMEADGVEPYRLIAQLMAKLDFPLHRRAARSLRVPVLVASSENDRIIEPARSFALVEALAAAAERVHLHFDDGGHQLQKHAAAKIAAAFSEMVSRAA